MADKLTVTRGGVITTNGPRDLPWFGFAEFSDGHLYSFERCRVRRRTYMFGIHHFEPDGAFEVFYFKSRPHEEALVAYLNTWSPRRRKA